MAINVQYNIHINSGQLKILQQQLDAVGATARKVDKQGVKPLAKGLKEAGETGKKAAQQIHISWQNVVRLLQVQILHQAIARIKVAFTEATRAAIDYSVAIAEVRTISQKAGDSTAAWSKEIRALSDDFNLELLDVVEGTYQAVSNQILKSAQNFRFMREEAKLATITVSTLNEAVQATTAVLNAFGLASSEAGRINAQLFKTVELGRVRLNEMSHDIGNVAILTSQLGGATEEMFGQIASFSIQGVKSKVAMTLMRNVMLKLIKPTEKMMELFAKAGVSSGPEFVQVMGGITGAMAEIERQAKATGNEMEFYGEVYGRIRAITGQVAFDTEKVAAAMDKITDSGDSAAKAFEKMEESAGRKLLIAMQEVKNFFVVDIGVAFVNFAGSITDLGGKIIATIKVIGRWVAIGASAFVLWRLKALAVIVATKAWSLVLLIQAARLKADHALVNLTLVKYHALKLVVKNVAISFKRMSRVMKVALASIGPLLLLEGVIYIWNKYTESVEKAAEALKKERQLAKETARSLDDDANKLDAKRLKSLRNTLLDIKRAIVVTTAQISTEASNELERLKEAFKDMSRTAMSASKEAVSAMRSVLTDLNKEVNVLEKALDKIKSQQQKTKDQLLTNRIEKDFGRERRDFARQPDQFSLAKEKAQENFNNALRAEKAITASLLSGDLNRAKAAEKLRDAHIEQAKFFAQTRIDAPDAVKAQFFLATLDIVDAEKDLQEQILAFSKAQTAELERRLALQGKQVTLEEKLLATKIKERDQTAASVKSFEDQLKIIDRLIAKRSDTDTIQQAIDKARDIAGKGGFSVDVLDTVRAYAKEAELLAENIRLQKVQQQILDDIAIKRERALAQLVRLDTEQTALNANLKKQKELATGINQGIGDGDGAFKGLDSVAEKIRKITDPLANSAKILADTDSKLAKKYGDLVKLAKSIDQPGIDIEEKFARVKEVLKAVILLNVYFRSIGANKGAIAKSFQNLITGKDNVAKLVGVIGEKMEDLTALKAEAADISIFNAEQLSDVVDEFKDIITQLNKVESTTKNSANNMKDLVTFVNILSGVKINLPSIVGNVINKASGGHIGSPRGTDTVPAWLTPGEFVMTNSATRMFRPMLEAMNRKGSAGHFADGGVVSNFGDVNVTVNESNTPQATARSVVAQIQREVRRGTVRI